MPEPKQSVLVEYNKAFLEKIQQLKEDMHKKYMDISNEPTPQFDGSGESVIKKRPDGLDYLKEAYMRTKLDQYFPGWSWQDGHVQFLGSEWIIADGHLCILDELLLPFGVIPPVRKYFGTGAARIQFKTCSCKKSSGYPNPACKICMGTGSLPHTAENVVDIDKNVKSANSNAFKVSINRLCRIGDDVYGKRVDEEGSGSIEDVMSFAGVTSSRARDVFFNYIAKKKILHTKAMATLKVSSWSEIVDWKEAYDKIKEEL